MNLIGSGGSGRLGSRAGRVSAKAAALFVVVALLITMVPAYVFAQDESGGGGKSQTVTTQEEGTDDTGQNMTGDDPESGSPPQEEPPSQETAYPAFETSAVFDDFTVHVSAPEGAFPAGIEAGIIPVSLKTETEEALNEAVGEDGEIDDGYAAVDITFSLNGETVQPLIPISLDFDFAEDHPLAEAEGLQVFHIDNVEADVVDPEAAVAEIIEIGDPAAETIIEPVAAEMTDGGVSFEAEQFSIYATIGATPGVLTSIDTIDSKSMGVTIRMKDYSSAASGLSIGGSYGDGTTKEGLLKRTLADGYPETSGGVNLSSLFGGTEANHLFLKEEYDATGYFFYDAAETFAEFSGDTVNDAKNFKVYHQLGTPSNASNYFYKRGNFMPYNTLNVGSIRNYNLYDYLGQPLSADHLRYEEPLYNFNESNNFYFGMDLSTNFYMPKNGQLDGENMVFEFTGDDDMWVFIDNTLVLDLGGIHDAQSGSINFATGEVQWTDTVTNGTTIWRETTIKEMFEAAGITPADGWNGETFANYTYHSFKIFYMERGAGASNLRMKFNLPTLPEGEIAVTKEVDGVTGDLLTKDDFTLQLYLKKKGTDEFVLQKGVSYKIGDDPHTTDAGDGTFTLKHGQSAIFSGIEDGDEFYVVEKNLDDYDVGFTMSTGEGGVPNPNDHDPDQKSNIYTYSFNENVVSLLVKNTATVTDVAELTVEKLFAGTTNGGAAPNGFAATFTVTRLETDENGNVVIDPDTGEGKIVGTPIARDWDEVDSDSQSSSGYDSDGNWYWTLNVPSGTYKVTETIINSGTGEVYRSTSWDLTITTSIGSPVDVGDLTSTNQYSTIDFPLSKGDTAVVTYTNAYGIIPTGALSLSAGKTANKAMTADQFTFSLYKSDASGSTGAFVETKTNPAGSDVAIDFSTINLTSTDTLYYLVKETAVSSGGWASDAAWFLATVTVTDNGSGVLTPSVTWQKSVDNGQNWTTVTAASFANTYTAAGARSLSAGKTANKAMAADQFTFSLYKSDASGATGAFVETKTNPAGSDVAIDFSTINLTSTDTLYYLVKETVVSSGGWASDPSLFLATVTVSDNGSGVLTPSVTWQKSLDNGQNWTTVTAASFRNTAFADLTLGKIVANADDDDDTTFVYEATFTYNGIDAESLLNAITLADVSPTSGVAATWAKNPAVSGTITFTGTLANGQKVIFENVPAGATYIVTETVPAGYTPTPYVETAPTSTTAVDSSSTSTDEPPVSTRTITDTMNEDVIVTYTNTPLVGLTLGKDVPGSSEEEFEFTVSFEYGGTDAEALLGYITIVGETSLFGTPTQTGTTSTYIVENTVTLAAGETVTFANIPKGATYSITETPSATGDYADPIITVTDLTPTAVDATINSPSVTGTLNESQTASYENVPLYTLTLGKDVVDGEGEELFVFKVVFENGAYGDLLKKMTTAETGTNASANKSPDDENWDGKTWDVMLADEDSVTFSNIPYGTDYKITEVLLVDVDNNIDEDAEWYTTIMNDGDPVPFDGPTFTDDSEIATGSFSDKNNGVPNGGSQIIKAHNIEVLYTNTEINIAVEVDMDTIQRTAAAYSSSILGDGIETTDSPVENAATDQYVYEVDFRSLSNVPLDSFVVTDGLEGVNGKKIIVDELWTPVVYGDILDEWGGYYEDGNGVLIPDYVISWTTASGQNGSVFASAGGKGIAYIAGDPYDFGEDEPVNYIDFTKLGEPVTSLEFNFGKVDVGFTSKNHNDEDTNEFEANNALIEPFAQTGIQKFASLFTPIVTYAADNSNLDWRGTVADGVDGLLPATYTVRALNAMADSTGNIINGTANAFGTLGTQSNNDEDRVMTRNLAVQTQIVDDPVPLLSYNDGYVEVSLTRYSTIPKTGDNMILQIPIALLIAALAAMFLLIANARRKKHAATEGAPAQAASPRKGWMKKGKLFSLLLVMVMAGTAFVPMSVSATTYPAAEDAQYYFSVDKGFTDDQLVQIKAALLAAGVPMDVVNQIQPAGGKTATVLIERVVPVTLGVTTNDVNSIVLAAFDAEAPDVVIEGSADTMEASFTGATTVNNPIQLKEATADLQRALENGGIAFERTTTGRPSLTDEYSATVNYRGQERVAGYSAFTATIGDLPIVEVITDVVTTVVGGGVAAAAGGGAGGAGGAGGEGEAVIPDGETPLDDGAGAETTIPEVETPLDDGGTGDNGGTTTGAGMPWWVWVIIAAVVIAIVALIAVRRRNAVTGDE